MADKPPTIIDVAREAGVSKSSASRALLGHSDVSQETLARVLAAADRLGYVPNEMARGLVSRRTKMLGALLRDTSIAFYGLLQVAMQRRARELGYGLVSMTGAGELTENDAGKMLRTLISLQVDGLLVSAAQLRGEDLVGYADRVPIVVVGRAESTEGIVSVFCDEVDGGTRMGEYVVRLGHRSVAVLQVPQTASASQFARTQSMIDTLKASGVTVSVIPLSSHLGPVGSAVAAALSNPTITALMCPSDVLMVQVLEELRVRAIPVPGQLSVTGYDGFGVLADPLFAFTTFQQPVEQIAALAVDRVVEWIEQGRPDQMRMPVQGQLVPGRTTAPPRPMV